MESIILLKPLVQQMPIVAVLLWMVIYHGKQQKERDKIHANAVQQCHDQFSETLSRINDDCHAHADDREEEIQGLTKRVLGELEESRADTRVLLEQVLDGLKKQDG